MSSRLFTEVRERNGLAYYVFAHHAAYADTGTLFSQAGVDTDRIDLAVTTILKRVSGDGVRAGRRGRAAPRQELPQGPHGAPARGLARADHLRPAARGAREPPRRAKRGAGRDRGGHRGRCPAAWRSRSWCRTVSTSGLSARSTTRIDSWSSWPRSPQCHSIEPTRCFTATWPMRGRFCRPTRGCGTPTRISEWMTTGFARAPSS